MKNISNFLLLILAGILIPHGAYCQKKLDSLAFKNALQEFDRNSFVIIGEAHEVEGTYGTELYLLNEFFKKGYKTIIYEGGTAEAIIFNEYLRTGDDTLLEYTRGCVKNYGEYIKKVREISRSYKDIQIKGVDFERSVCLEQVFNKWFKHINNPNLKKPIRELNKINEFTSAKKVKKILLTLRKDFHIYETDFEKVLKKDAALLKKIIFNPVFEADYGFSSEKRDENIAKNLLKFSRKELKESILIFGSNHFTYPKHFWPDFAKEIKGKVDCLLFLFGYKNCTNLMKPEKYSSFKPLADFLSEDNIEDPKVTFVVEKNKELALAQKDNKLVIVKLLNQ